MCGTRRGAESGEIKTQTQAKQPRFQNATKVDYSETKLIYTKINQAQDYFKTQGKVDIEQYRDSATKQFDNRNTITVDYKRMPKTVQQRFNRALTAKYSPYRAEALGAWGVQLKLKRK